MPYCKYCGKQNTETAKFCIGCGKPNASNVPSESSQTPFTNTVQKNIHFYWLLGFAGIIIIATGVYFLIQNNRTSIKKESQATAPAASQQNNATFNNSKPESTSVTAPFTNNNPTVINGEDVYKGYETGKFPVYIHAIYKHENKYYMGVDLVQVFEGTAVEKAKKEDKIPYDEYLDDFYIRNNYSTLRTYEIDLNCMIYPKREEKDIRNNNGYGFLTFMNVNLKDRLFYIHIANRICYKMEEQFFS